MKKMMFAVMAMLFSVSAMAEVPTLRFCSGAEGGFYADHANTIGKKIINKTGGQLEVLNTGGSIDNAEKLYENECDIAILQADAVVTNPMPPSIKVSNSHQEVVFWIHGPTGLEDFGDIEQSANISKYAVAIVSGSGGQVVMKKFGEVDEDYKAVRVVEFDSWDEAAEAAGQGYTMVSSVRVEIAGLLYVGRAGKVNSDIVENFEDILTVGEINDGDFGSAVDANKNPLYTQCEISQDDTSGLKTDGISDRSTYCVQAQIVYNNDFHNKLPEAEKKMVKKAVNKAIISAAKSLRG